jgi:hypothetical protein
MPSTNWQLFISFFKIGSLSFGGGPTAITKCIWLPRVIKMALVKEQMAWVLFDKIRAASNNFCC